MSWQDKVKEAIAAQCEESRKVARGNRKRHVPYAVPALARAMVDALNADDECEGKRLLLLYRTGAESLV
jgi:hypothetical protein